MCRLRNLAMRDYQKSVTTGQTHRHTDGQRTKWSLCAAILRRRHNRWTTELDLLLNYENVSLNICNEYGMPTLTAQGTLTPPVTWSRLIWDLHASTTHSVIHVTLWVQPMPITGKPVLTDTRDRRTLANNGQFLKVRNIFFIFYCNFPFYKRTLSYPYTDSVCRTNWW